MIGRPGSVGRPGLGQPRQPRRRGPSNRDRDKEREQLRLQEGVDPVTGEDTTGDKQFKLELVAYRVDIPEALVPKRWKTDDDKEADAGDAAQPAPRPTPPSRDGR